MSKVVCKCGEKVDENSSVVKGKAFVCGKCGADNTKAIVEAMEAEVCPECGCALDGGVCPECGWESEKDTEDSEVVAEEKSKKEGDDEAGTSKVDPAVEEFVSAFNKSVEAIVSEIVGLYVQLGLENKDAQEGLKGVEPKDMEGYLTDRFSGDLKDKISARVEEGVLILTIPYEDEDDDGFVAPIGEEEVEIDVADLPEDLEEDTIVEWFMDSVFVTEEE